MKRYTVQFGVFGGIQLVDIDYRKDKVYGLLCTGCDEIIIIGGGTEVQCDLDYTSSGKLKKLLGELKPPNAVAEDPGNLR